MFFPRLPLRAALAGLALCALLAGPAQARIFLGIGVPLWIGPPIFVPPPAWYPPYYAPQGGPMAGSEFSYVPPGSRPQSLAPGGYSDAESCQAGPYVCPLVRETPRGGDCGCLGNDGRRVRGRAN